MYKSDVRTSQESKTSSSNQKQIDILNQMKQIGQQTANNDDQQLTNSFTLLSTKLINYLYDNRATQLQIIDILANKLLQVHQSNSAIVQQSAALNTLTNQCNSSNQKNNLQLQLMLSHQYSEIQKLKRQETDFQNQYNQINQLIEENVQLHNENEQFQKQLQINNEQLIQFEDQQFVIEELKQKLQQLEIQNQNIQNQNQLLQLQLKQTAENHQSKDNQMQKYSKEILNLRQSLQESIIIQTQPNQLKNSNVCNQQIQQISDLRKQCDLQQIENQQLQQKLLFAQHEAIQRNQEVFDLQKLHINIDSKQLQSQQTIQLVVQQITDLSVEYKQLEDIVFYLNNKYKLQQEQFKQFDKQYIGKKFLQDKSSQVDNVLQNIQQVNKEIQTLQQYDLVDYLNNKDKQQLLQKLRKQIHVFVNCGVQVEIKEQVQYQQFQISLQANVNQTPRFNQKSVNLETFQNQQEVQHYTVQQQPVESSYNNVEIERLNEIINTYQQVIENNSEKQFNTLNTIQLIKQFRCQLENSETYNKDICFKFENLQKMFIQLQQGYNQLERKMETQQRDNTTNKVVIQRQVSFQSQQDITIQRNKMAINELEKKIKQLSKNNNGYENKIQTLLQFIDKV